MVQFLTTESEQNFGFRHIPSDKHKTILIHHGEISSLDLPPITVGFEPGTL